jgi:hypothetical protein
MKPTKAVNCQKKAAFDLKQAVTAACMEKAGITAKNECILELDKKVRDTEKFDQ